MIGHQGPGETLHFAAIKPFTKALKKITLIYLFPKDIPTLETSPH